MAGRRYRREERVSRFGTRKDVVTRQCLRRDPRRAQAALWSATNRVFACDDATMLAEVLGARADGYPAADAVAIAVDRDLSRSEVAAIRVAEDQLDALIGTEVAELATFGWTDQ
jgi:hypothetical protein